MDSSNDDVEKAKLYLQLALKTEDTIQQAYTKLMDKIKSIFTLASALVPIVAALGYFIAKETSSYWILFPIFFSIAAFVVAICLGITLFRPKSFKYVDPNFIAREYSKKPLRYVINMWASTYCKTAIKNAKVVNSAEKRLNYMYSCIIIGLGIFGVSFLLLAFSLTNIGSILG